MTDVELVAEHDHRVGEGPLWHPEEDRCYWVDIPTGRLFRYDPAADESEQVLAFDRPLGGCTLQTDGSFACFLGGGGVARWDPDAEDDSDLYVDQGTGAVEFVVDSITEAADSRFNDVLADPEGRAFAGTMPTADALGSLYRIDADGSYRLADDRGYDIPNGMGFAPDDESLYVTESEARTIYRFDYDRTSGALSNRTVFARVPADDGVPDGMTVDEDGHVWSARWGGGCVVRHAPDGSVVDRIEVPAPKVSAVTFGGPDYGDLYVTTAKGHDAEDDPPAGSLFRATPDVGGVPEYRSEIRT